MKKVVYFLVALFAITALTSCPNPPETKRTIEISVAEVGTNDATIHFTPSDSGTWYCFFASEEDWVKYGYADMADEDLIADDFNYMSGNNISSYLHEGEKDMPMMYLTPNTTYHIWAAYLAEDGTNDGVVFRSQFTTNDIVRSSITFELTMENDTIIVTPSNDDMYLVYIVTKGYLDQFYCTPGTYLALVAQMMGAYGEIEENWVSGVTRYPMSDWAALWSASAGNVCLGVGAVAVDTYGNLLSDYAEEYFTFNYDGNGVWPGSEEGEQQDAPMKIQNSPRKSFN